MIKIRKERLLLNPEDIKPSAKELEVLGVLNPGAVRLKDGRIMLYARVIEKLKKIEDKNNLFAPKMVGKKEFKLKVKKFSKKLIKENTDFDFHFKDGTKRLTFFSHFRKVILDKSGFKVLSLSKKPDFFGTVNEGEYGVEDPRITKIEDMYVMTYVALSKEGSISTNIAVSKDLKNWERKGIVFGQQDKDVVIFPEKINDKYVAFDRPEGSFSFTPPHIWIAYSKDLQYWGKLNPVSLVDEEYVRNGAGPPPIKTDKGWLLIYHTVKNIKTLKKKKIFYLKKCLGITKDEDYDFNLCYSVGAALFDLQNPRKLIAKTKKPILYPKRKYETSFEGKKVIFPTGLVMDKNGKDILLYSGVGDTSISVKKISLDDVMKVLVKV